MAHGLNSVLKKGVASVSYRNEQGKGVGSRRIFAPHFKLQVLDSYRNDADCKGNQRATARKYGIHRRQIQKWLQVENTLRNSVSNANEKIITDKNVLLSDNRKSCNGLEMALNANRQRDDEQVESASITVSGIEEARVPALTTRSSPSAAPYPYESLAPPLPIDYTVRRSRVHNASPSVACASASNDSVHYHHHTSLSSPIDLSFKRPTEMPPSGAPVCLPLSPQIPMSSSPEPHPDVWDLSTKRKCQRSPSPVQTPRFTTHCVVPENNNNPKPVKLFKPYLDDIQEPDDSPIKIEPGCPNAHSIPSISSTDAYMCNNNICEIKSEYGNTQYTHYTLHELQPKCMNYFYPTYPDYELGVYCYEDISYGQNLAPIKQRQSYSLDFKLSAIDCYYQDSVCKGNQRAVATKYNIHRRQVQKWLKQAEELRLRNESVKQLHAVR